MTSRASSSSPLVTTRAAGPKGAAHGSRQTHRTCESKKITTRNAWIAKRLLQGGVLVNKLFYL